MSERLFDYLREHPEVLAAGVVGTIIVVVVVIVLLDVFFRILDDPQPQQVKKDDR